MREQNQNKAFEDTVASPLRPVGSPRLVPAPVILPARAKIRVLQKTATGVRLVEAAAPQVENDDDVIIRVVVAGICRTDIFAAEGRIATKEPVVLGHEFSGIVEKTGDGVRHVREGERVTVMPIMPCGACKFCLVGKTAVCQHTTMLGIDRDGCFGEALRVPGASVYKLPENMSFREGAYAEPVAAAMSVLRAGLGRGEKGVIYGNNRFGQLLGSILHAKGFQDITIFDPSGGAVLEESAYDFAVETLATTETMVTLMRAVRPQGKVVLKSRKPEAVGIPFAEAIRKELTFSAVNYGCFAETLELMASGALALGDLLGEVHPLEDFAAVFERSKTRESRKTFFGLVDKDVWDC